MCWNKCIWRNAKFNGFSLLLKIGIVCKMAQKVIGGQVLLNFGQLLCELLLLPSKRKLFQHPDGNGKATKPTTNNLLPVLRPEIISFSAATNFKKYNSMFCTTFFLLQKAIIHVLLLLIHYFIRGGSFHLLLDFFFPLLTWWKKAPEICHEWNTLGRD